MTTPSPHDPAGAPAPGAPATNPYTAPAEPMSAKELRRQKRMQKAGRNWFARHKILTGLLVLAGVGVIGAALGGGDDADPSAGAVDRSSESSERPAEPSGADTDGAAEDGARDDAAEEVVAEPEPEPQLPGIGDVVQADEFAITVTAVETGIAHVGSEYLGEQAQGQFVLVRVSIENTGTTAETFWDNDATLIDTLGREHSTSSASIYLDEESSWLLTEINPGNTASGALLFDIPADAEVDVLRVRPGVFSSDTDIALR